MKRRKQTSRSGAILIAVLVTLLVVMSMVGTTILVSIRAYRERQTERQLAQTQFLCEAGARRAIELRAQYVSFKGDAWTPPLEDGSDAVVSVSSTIHATDDDKNWIEVTASIEGGVFAYRVQRTKKYPISLSTKVNAESL